MYMVAVRSGISRSPRHFSDVVRDHPSRCFIHTRAEFAVVVDLQRAFREKMRTCFASATATRYLPSLGPFHRRHALKLIERTFGLYGPEGLGAKPRPELIGPIFMHLHDTLQDAVRMGFLHSSRARGRISDSLKAAADVHYLGHSGSEDATLLHFEVPSFGSVAAELFDQQTFWDDGPKPEDTAFELFGAALTDVRRRQKDSSRFDPALLRRIGGYRRMLNRGIERIGMPDTSLPERGEIDADAVQAASELGAATPHSRRVRVAGRLDLMGKTRRC
jgi:hypothetical protein